MKSAREKASVSKSEVARRLNRSPRSISRIEAGEIEITLRMVQEYSEATGVYFGTLAHGVEPIQFILSELDNLRKESSSLLKYISKLIENRLNQEEKKYRDQFSK